MGLAHCSQVITGSSEVLFCVNGTKFQNMSVAVAPSSHCYSLHLEIRAMLEDMKLQ